jgi:hypothetical protein
VGFAHKQHAFRTQVNNYEAQLEQLRTKVQAALKDQLSTELYEVTGGVQVPLDHRIEFQLGLAEQFS